jgi:hypothetical protein
VTANDDKYEPYSDDWLRPSSWQRWSDGTRSCAVCGAQIHGLMLEVHSRWHRESNTKPSDMEGAK